MVLVWSKLPTANPQLASVHVELLRSVASSENPPVMT
jgi:hypothetical protein